MNIWSSIKKGTLIAVVFLLACMLSVTQGDTVVQVRIVRMPIIVTDRENHFVTDLKQEEVQVFEDKQELPLVGFEKEEEQSIRYVIALDTSGSFKKILPRALKTAAQIISHNAEKDETGIVRFISSDKIELAQDFTADKAKLIESLSHLNIAMGQSAVIDAIYVAVQKASAPTNTLARRSVVLISDGEDRNSYYKFEDLAKLLRQTRVQVFVIGMIDELDKEAGFIRTSQRDKAQKLLTNVAQESFGRVFFPRDNSELQIAAEEIANNLHTQFYIGFNPTNQKPGQHSVDVKLTRPGEKLTLVTRTRYVIERPNEKQKP